MSRRKVLFVVHNHPAVRPGGAEKYALELYEALRAQTDFEPILLARIGPDTPVGNLAHRGTPFRAVDGDPNQYFLFTDPKQFDGFFLTYKDKSLFSRHFRSFLKAHRPDLVHFQHTLFIGCDAVTEARRTLPDAPIVYTLHEYLPICHRNGQMLRREGDKPCLESGPRRCSECFPKIPPQRFFLRKRLLEHHLSNVDLFLAPSRFLKDRYVDWGIPSDRIRFEEYGRLPLSSELPTVDSRPRNRIGFFGQFNPYKGVTLLLEAMQSVATAAPEARLRLHGANLDLQPKEFQEQFNASLAASGENVTLVGRYDAAELPGLMSLVDWVVVPSIWWENSPLVIQEAFQCGRPVICSDIGGMAEKVQDGVNGLHFRVGDARSLTETLVRAASTPGLWSRLRAGIPPIYRMDEHVSRIAALYEELLSPSLTGVEHAY